jgi:hypothetical protein
MFLDEKLLEMCRTYDYTQGVSALLNQLCAECEDYYKTRITPTMDRKEVKAILDKTFNLWDSFVRMAIKDDNDDVRCMGMACEKYTFKWLFMRQPGLKQTYDSL